MKKSKSKSLIFHPGNCDLCRSAGAKTMNRKENFVDELMSRAFDLPAPEMPDFTCGKQDETIEELDLEQLEYLAAAGQTEIRISERTAEKP
jgi:hypothetical protein